MRLIKGEICNLEIKKLVYQGWGLGNINGFKVFVPDTIPGDIVNIRVVKKKRNYAVGKCLSFSVKSSRRSDSVCSVFPVCGGCQLIDLDYQVQVELKNQILCDCIKRFYPELESLAEPMLLSEETLFYRNKMEYSFGKDDAGIYCGLKQRGFFDRVVRINNCYLQSEESDDIRAFTGEFFTGAGSSIWDYFQHQGLLRYLVVRHSKTRGQYLVNLVVSEDDLDLMMKFAAGLVEKVPEVKTVMYSVNASVSDTAQVDSYRILTGEPFIEEVLGNIKYMISVQSFFQTNTKQAEKLYEKIVETGDFSRDDTVLDLYCGTGAIGLYISRNVKKVIGIEENEQAVRDAEKNAEYNSIVNIEFIAGRVKNILKFNNYKADCIIIDPPRAGIVPKALKRILDLRVKKIIYVSCNPVTLLRDLNEMKASGYKVERFLPVDMFPNTFHIESIVRLSFNSG